MDIETIAKGIGALGVIYTVGRGIVEHMSGRTSRMRDEYRFAKDFFKDIMQLYLFDQQSKYIEPKNWF